MELLNEEDIHLPYPEEDILLSLLEDVVVNASLLSLLPFVPLTLEFSVLVGDTSNLGAFSPALASPALSPTPVGMTLVRAI